MKVKTISFVITLTLLMTGCDSMPSKGTIGGAIGGIAGGVAGSQIGKGRGNTAATIAGVLIGAAIGSAIGSTMDNQDKQQAAQVLESAPDNEPVTWNNPNTNASYTVTPISTDMNTQCREYSTSAVINGKQETVYGKACRQPDGTWREAPK